MNSPAWKLTKTKIYCCPPRSRGMQNKKLENLGVIIFVIGLNDFQIKRLLKYYHDLNFDKNNL